MSVRRRSSTVLAALATAVVLVAAGCGATESTSPSTPVGTTLDVAALLGPTNKATGTPIKVGFVYDGKTMGIDQTAVGTAFNATVSYVNEHLGGINGHPIEVVECTTNNTPSDATNCGVKAVNEGVAAVLVPTSAQDATIFDPVSSAGIPYVTYAAGGQGIMIKPGGFLLVNPTALLAGPAKIAKDNGVKKAGIILIDVPASTGPVTALAKPMYDKLGIGVDVVPISPQTADMTPQIQQAIGGGAEQFSIIGTDDFNTSAIKALKQLGFQGRIVMVTAPTKAMAETVPGGLDGITYVTSTTDDPSDVDVQRYQAVLQTYMPDTAPVAQSAWAYVTVLGFVDALAGRPEATDAASIMQALGSMPEPLPVPLGAGLTYQCGAKPVALVPNVCTGNVLSTTLDEEGRGQGYSILDVSGYLTVGG